MISDLTGSKVDLLSTKNLDMKGRRIINAAPSIDPTDYVIKSELDQATSAQVNLFTNPIKFLSSLIVNGLATFSSYLTALRVGINVNPSYPLDINENGIVTGFHISKDKADSGGYLFSSDTNRSE